MAPTTRAASKAFLKVLYEYELCLKWVERALDPDKPSLVKSLAKNLEKLETCFSNLTFEWKTSKAELNVSKDEFNSVDESGVPVYEYNDNWLKNLEDAYVLVLEKAEDKLGDVPDSKKESASTNDDHILDEAKHKLESNLKLSSSLESQITSFTEGITRSIDAINKEVFNMADNSQSFNRVQSLKLDLNTLDNKIDEVLPRLFNQYASLLTKSEIEEKDTVRSEFCSREKGRI